LVHIIDYVYTDMYFANLGFLFKNRTGPKRPGPPDDL